MPSPSRFSLLTVPRPLGILPISTRVRRSSQRTAQVVMELTDVAAHPAAEHCGQ